MFRRRSFPVDWLTAVDGSLKPRAAAGLCSVALWELAKESGVGNSCEENVLWGGGGCAAVEGFARTHTQTHTLLTSPFLRNQIFFLGPPTTTDLNCAARWQKVGVKTWQVFLHLGLKQIAARIVIYSLHQNCAVMWQFSPVGKHYFAATSTDIHASSENRQKSFCMFWPERQMIIDGWRCQTSHQGVYHDSIVTCVHVMPDNLLTGSATQVSTNSFDGSIQRINVWVHDLITSSLQLCTTRSLSVKIASLFFFLSESRKCGSITAILLNVQIHISGVFIQRYSTATKYLLHPLETGWWIPLGARNSLYWC